MIKRSFFILIAVLDCCVSFAQLPSLKDLEDLPVFKLPLEANKGPHNRYKKLYDLPADQKMIEERLYEDLALKQCFTISDFDASMNPVVYGIFNIPGGDYYLYGINFGGYTDYTTDVLVCVNAEGEIKDVLEAMVMWFPGVAVKQYKVTERGTVVVYQLHETSSPQNGLTFKSFTGYRTDTEYRIDSSGHFQKVSEKRYKEKTYYYDDVKQKSNDIWKGGEVPID